MKKLLPAVLLLATSCATIDVHRGDAVRVTTNPDVVRGCTFLGNVEVGIWEDSRASENEWTLKNFTAKRGGDVVFVDNGRATTGEAYRCQ